MPAQIRLSQADDRFYSPDRDLAYCSPHLVHRAMQGLDPENQEPWIRLYLAENKIDPACLVDAAHAVAVFMNKSLTDPAFKEPFEALEASGFFELPAQIQHIVCAKLGQVFLSAMFSSIRDVTRKPNEPAYNTKEIADAAATLSDRMLTYRTRPAWVNGLHKFWRHLRAWWAK